MSPSAAASRSLVPPLPILKAPGVAQGGKNIGEGRFADLSREHLEILISTLKGCLSWRLNPPLSILRAVVTPGTAAAHLTELLLPWLPEDLQRELQPRAGAGSGGKSTPAALLLPHPAGELGAGKAGSSLVPTGGTALARSTSSGASRTRGSPHRGVTPRRGLDSSSSGCLNLPLPGSVHLLVGKC